MIGISTVWQSKNNKVPEDFLKELDQFELDGIELEYRVSSEMFAELLPIIKARNIRVLSLHNVCPASELSRQTPCLAAICEEERKTAVRLACETIQHAHDLEAGFVVVHLGEVPMPGTPKMFSRQFIRGEISLEEVKKCARTQLKEGAKKRSIHFDKALFSMDSILREAEKRGVKLGVENRYYLYQIPNFEEVGVILQEFAGANVGYWHDAGHAHAHETMGVTFHEAWLKAYSPIGMHLHDAVGLEDHQAPGKGEIAWEKLVPLFPENALRILELRPRETRGEVWRAVSFLRSLGVA